MRKTFLFVCILCVISMFSACTTSKQAVRESDSPSQPVRIAAETPLEIAKQTGDTAILERPNRDPLQALDPESYFIVYGTSQDMLINAVQSQDVVRVTGLLKNGKDINTADDYGNTAFMYAVHGHDLSLVKMMVQLYKANVHKGNKYGQQPVHVAVTDGNLSMLNMIRTFGIDLNARDNAGNTPLAIAIYSRNSAMVEMLLVNGANAKISLKGGITPYEQAVKMGDQEMERVIREKVR